MASPTAADPPPQLGRPVAGTEYSWCRAVAGGTGVTVVAIFLSRPVSLPLLHSALLRLQLAHPILRCDLTTAVSASPSSDAGAGAPAPADQPFFSIASPSSILRSVNAADILGSLPRPGVSTFHAVLEHEMNQNPWSEPAKSVPVFFTTVYEMPEPAGRSVLALRFHTAVCDKTSAVAVLREFLGLLSQPPAAAAAAAEEENGEVELMPGIEELIPKADTWKPFWARGKDLVGYSINGLRTSTLLFEDPAGTPRRSEMVRMTMTVEETNKLLTACKERSIKLCGAISAAAMIAARSSKNIENDQCETYNVMTLINCRKYLDPVLDDHVIGFYHSAIINTHNVHGHEVLWSLATKCHNSYSNSLKNKKHLRDIGELNFLMCKAIENPHLTPCSSLRSALISVFEEPVIYQSSEVPHELGVEDYVGFASVHGVGPSIAVFDTIRDGQLDCTFVYPSPVHSRKQIFEILEHMKRLLLEESNDNEEYDES